MDRQFTFDLPVVENRSRGDYFVSPSNALAFQTIEQLAYDALIVAFGDGFEM